MTPRRRAAGRRASAAGLVVGAVALAGALSARTDGPDADVGSLAAVAGPPAAPTTTTTGAGVPPTTLGSTSARLEDQPVRQVAVPVRLRVDALGLDAAIGAIGAAPSGALDVPPEAGLVGWYHFGAAPGEPGSAVLAGHVDYDGRLGVFARLHELEPGAEVVVTTADGGTRRFTTTARRQFPKAELPTDLVFSRAGAPALALVTCGGSFDAGGRSYRDNVVVFATPAG